MASSDCSAGSAASSPPESSVSLDTSKPYFGLTAEHYREKLGLIRHPEGGWFVETYRSGAKPMSSGGKTSDDPAALTMTVQSKSSQSDSSDESTTELIRQPCTVIYWLQDAETSPRIHLHRSGATSIHIYNAGFPSEFVLVDTDTWTVHRHVVGPDILQGQTIQLEVPGHWWKCIFCAKDFSLLSETCCPGFDYRDWCLVTSEQVSSSGLSEDDKRELMGYTAKKEATTAEE